MVGMTHTSDVVVEVFQGVLRELSMETLRIEIIQRTLVCFDERLIDAVT